MLVDLLKEWARQAEIWILSVFQYIFPEYPKIGIAVCITAVIFLIYYLVKAEPKSALKMTGSTLVFFIVLLYSIHWLIKLYRVMV